MDRIDAVDGNCLGSARTKKGHHAAAENQLDAPEPAENRDLQQPPVTEATHYDMNHERTGKAIIFNHEYFTSEKLKIVPRPGTQKDCDNISAILTDRGFDVSVYHNLDRDVLFSTVAQAVNDDYSDCGCFAMVVLSHGDVDELHARNASYQPHQLWSPFTDVACPALAGKPKLFFIQACQGNKVDGGVTMLSKLAEPDSGPPSSDNYSFQFLSQPDVLISCSTVPGYFSWRNPTRGSWFIQALCDELIENGYKYDLLTLLTFVNLRVATGYESCRPAESHMDKQKQIPFLRSMLTKLLRFTEGKTKGKLTIASV